MSIEVSQLLKLYGEQKAVNQISFSVQQGEIVGFLGPNGAGKSTTMKMITGYLQPDGGQALVSGIDMARYPVEAKKKIGYLPEANPLYYDMYVREYLQFIAGVHQVPNLKKRIEEVIALTGLTAERTKKTGQLSKGYKQRVGLAAALIHDPEVLILDEPTSGLDPNQIVEIRNVIQQQGQSKTVLFSSHILQEVQAICSRVIIIHQGRIVADKTMQELQQQQGQNKAVLVSFAENIQTNWLHNLSSVLSVSSTGTYNWQLQTSDAALTRKQLLELALRENLNILSLQTAGDSLEAVFRELTRHSSPGK